MADKPTETKAQHRTEDAQVMLATTHTHNWETLAEHVQAKVLKRTADVSYLHTKAGFLIAACVVVLQILSGLGKYSEPLAIFGVATAGVLTIASLVLSILSMVISKSASPLNIDDMVLQMNKGFMKREVFSKWLVDCYNLANKEFNKVYVRKYYQQLIAAIILVVSILIIIILKGFELYG